MNKKLFYTAPEAEDLELRFEASFLKTGFSDQGTEIIEDDGEDDL